MPYFYVFAALKVALPLCLLLLLASVRWLLQCANQEIGRLSSSAAPPAQAKK